VTTFGQCFFVYHHDDANQTGSWTTSDFTSEMIYIKSPFTAEIQALLFLSFFQQQDSQSAKHHSEPQRIGGSHNIHIQPRPPLSTTTSENTVTMSDTFSNFSFAYDYVTSSKSAPKTSLRSDGPRPFPTTFGSSTTTWGSTVPFIPTALSSSYTTTWTSGPTYK
jgi:hypothetical protein